MKHSKRCPKCGSTDILRIEGNCGAYGVGKNIPTGVILPKPVLVHRYLCCDCGYSEEWIDKEDIPALVKKFKK